MRALLKACFMLQIWSPRPALTNRSWNMPQKQGLSAESFQPGEIKDVVVRDLRKFNDRRGWLTELFRHDQLEAKFFPAMAYISSTNPKVARGPHEPVDQADPFFFFTPST